MEAGDAESMLALVSCLRGVTRVRPGGEQPGMRVVRHAVGPVSMDHLTVRTGFEAEIYPVGTLVFGRLEAGSVGFRAGPDERWYAQGDVYLAGPAWQRRTVMARAGEHQQAVIDAAFVGQVAGRGPGSEGGPVRFTGYEPASAQAADRWKATCDYVWDTVLAAGDYPLLAGNAARLIAATALTVFPNDALTGPAAEDRADGSPAALRRAVAFIDEHAHEDITAADIAAAACVTIRSVQLAFRRHLDTTPTEYLRRVRLDHAHRQLVAADPDHESVTAVAYRWGFPSPSRFAAAYREAYGVLPSRSLRG
jgi:AraC-like DNA-binding protein